MSFAAKFPGICEDCGGKIQPGQIIATVRGEKRSYVHVGDCEEQDPVPMIKRPVCGKCFQEVAANGSCACEA